MSEATIRALTHHLVADGVAARQMAVNPAQALRKLPFLTERDRKTLSTIDPEIMHSLAEAAQRYARDAGPKHVLPIPDPRRRGGRYGFIFNDPSSGVTGLPGRTKRGQPTDFDDFESESLGKPRFEAEIAEFLKFLEHAGINGSGARGWQSWLTGGGRMPGGSSEPGLPGSGPGVPFGPRGGDAMTSTSGGPTYGGGRRDPGPLPSPPIYEGVPLGNGAEQSVTGSTAEWVRYYELMNRWYQNGGAEIYAALERAENTTLPGTFADDPLDAPQDPPSGGKTRPVRVMLIRPKPSPPPDDTPDDGGNDDDDPEKRNRGGAGSNPNPEDPDGYSPIGPRARYRALRPGDTMPNPEDPGGGGPIGPWARGGRSHVGASRAMPNPFDNGGGPVGPWVRARTMAGIRDTMPNPEDPDGDAGPQGRYAARRR